MNQYRRSYHNAINHLIAFSPWDNRELGRRLVAQALWDLRRDHGRKRAIQERHHMQFIGGMLPSKVTFENRL